MTSSPAISVAGDGAGIGGARAAAIQGKLSALAVLEKLGLGALEHKRGIQKNLQLRLSDEMAIRPFLDALYAPPQEILRPVDDVIICRCEDVTAGDIRQYARLGCTGPNQAKAFGRSGMGPCQGRYCGLTVTELLAEATGVTRNDVGYYRLRSPLKPVTLGELASLASGNDEKETE
jgi:bacterioferritin-associated ferredoxin